MLAFIEVNYISPCLTQKIFLKDALSIYKSIDCELKWHNPLECLQHKRLLQPAKCMFLL
jgi:hypothetical protein